PPSRSARRVAFRTSRSAQLQIRRFWPMLPTGKRTPPPSAASAKNRFSYAMPKKPLKKKSKKTSKFSAKTADKHDLYQRSVQDAATEVYFINRAYKSKRG